MANNKKNEFYTVKDCTPFSQDVNDDVLKKLSEYFEKTAGGSNDDDDKIVSLQTMLYPYEEGEPTVQTRWWAGRYIGLANIAVVNKKGNFDHFEISIKPRFGQRFLLAILEDLYNIKVGIHDAQETASSEWFSALLNILRRRMWVDKCAKANRYGLPRKNVRREHQGVTQKGSLDIRRTIMPWLTQKEICTNSYEKVFDDTICKIVYEAHRILSQDVIGKIQDKKRKQNISIGFSMPPMVQDTINALNTQYKGTRFDVTDVDYKRIRYNNIYMTWKPLVDFSWDVIRNRKLGYRSAETQGECILVDMAEIWEAFLRKKLGEGFADGGWRVLSVEECKYKIYQGKFFERLIIPDIILTRTNSKGESEYMVFDAKYKRMRISNESKGYDVDRTDLFQIHTYIQFVEHHLGHVVVGGLLYPLTQKMQDEEGHEVELKIDTTRFHSADLYGKESGKYSNTSFIIDGVFCSKSDDAEGNVGAMDENVTDMIGRIKRHIDSASI